MSLSVNLSRLLDRVVWTFNQNGTFGYTNDQNLTSKSRFLYSDGYIQIVLTDARAVSDADKKFRSAVVLIDSSGRVEVALGVISVLCAI